MCVLPVAGRGQKAWSTDQSHGGCGGQTPPSARQTAAGTVLTERLHRADGCWGLLHLSGGGCVTLCQPRQVCWWVLCVCVHVCVCVCVVMCVCVWSCVWCVCVCMCVYVCVLMCMYQCMCVWPSAVSVCVSILVYVCVRGVGEVEQLCLRKVCTEGRSLNTPATRTSFTLAP